jgi:hypothetical protein
MEPEMLMLEDGRDENAIIPADVWQECPYSGEGKSMQSKKFSLLFLTGLVVVMAACGALAQSQKTAHANIPFEFWIGGNRLPAGDYVIEHLESTSYLYFRNTDGKSAQDVYTLPVDDVPAKDGESQLVFALRDANHYLYGGWGPFGRRVVVSESVRPAPSGENRIEVPISFR